MQHDQAPFLASCLAQPKLHGRFLQVETAQGLTIRVINNVSKRMEVKPRFHEAFQKEGCPDAFPYRQKVSLLLPPQSTSNPFHRDTSLNKYRSHLLPPEPATVPCHSVPSSAAQALHQCVWRSGGVHSLPKVTTGLTNRTACILSVRLTCPPSCPLSSAAASQPVPRVAPTMLHVYLPTIC